MIGIGIMSGSSLDGLDIVAVEFSSVDNLNWSIKAYETVEIHKNITERLNNILESKAKEIFFLESDYTLGIADLLKSFLDRHNITPDYIAVHGHTVAHSPLHKSSWQLLNGGLLASTMNCDVVCDFRSADMALGGQGTPMAVLADRDLFSGYDFYINLGGIANISYQKNNKWVAYDLFPFNQVFNHYARKEGHAYDDRGQIAASGKINKSLLNQLLAEPYVNKPFPKSIDNEWVKNYWIDKINNYDIPIADVMHTYVDFSAEIISGLVYTDSKILWTGGGVHHTHFMNVIKSKKIQNVIPDQIIIDSKESVLIAYAGYLRLQGRANFIATATGASADVIGGAVYVA